MGLQHVALEMDPLELDRAIAFFVILGFEEVAAPATLEGRARWLAHGGTQIHLLLSENPVAPTDGHAAVLISDLEQIVARLCAAGYEVRPTFPHWGAERVFALAPCGHRVELMSSAPPAA